MMMNLFSSFDPSSNLNLSLNWMSSLIGLLIIPFNFWFTPSRINLLWNYTILMLHKEFKLLLNKSDGKTLILISLFSYILFNNFLGLFPYIFTSSSHMIMTMTMAIPLWISFMIFGWLANTQQMLTHLVPCGTPYILAPFMVCIETISNLIRPGTLAIRLSANMIAGHLLLTLLGNTGSMISMMFISILLLTQILLLILELAVAIIQSYVFAILMTLYSSEVN